MIDFIWSTVQRRRVVFEHIHEMQWNDTASREIHLRFLNPFENDSEEMSGAFTSQHNALENVKTHTWATHCHGGEAQEAGAEVNRHYNYAYNEMNYAQHELDLSRVYETVARNKLLNIHQLITNAENAGNA